MASRNPYQPPESKPQGPMTSGRVPPVAVIVAIVAALQIAASVASVPAGLEMVRTGELSPAHALLFACSVMSLAIAGAFLLRKPPAARYAAGFALLSALVLLSQWRPLLYVTQSLVAAGLVVLTLAKSRMKDA